MSKTKSIYVKGQGNMEFVLVTAAIAAIVSFIFLYTLMRKEFVRQKLKEPGTQYELKSKPISDRQPDDSDVTTKEPANYIQQAANTCLYMPLIYLFMAQFTRQSITQPHLTGFVISIIILLMMITGLVMAIIAISTYRKHNDKKILRKGIAGFLINGFFVCIIFMAATLL